MVFHDWPVHLYKYINRNQLFCLISLEDGEFVIHTFTGDCPRGRHDPDGLVFSGKRETGLLLQHLLLKIHSRDP